MAICRFFVPSMDHRQVRRPDDRPALSLPSIATRNPLLPASIFWRMYAASRSTTSSGSPVNDGMARTLVPMPTRRTCPPLRICPLRLLGTIGLTDCTWAGG